MNVERRSAPTQTRREEVTLREFILKVRDFLRYLRMKWMVVLGMAFFGAVLLLLIATLRKTQYTARLSFIVEEQGGGSGGLGAAAGIAAQLGFNLSALTGSGGFFEGDNIIEFLRSRSMIDKTLLTEVEVDGRKERLVDRYIAYNGLREKWAKKPHLRDIEFKDTTGIYLQDSLLAEFYQAIVKRNLEIGKIDKRFNIILVEMKTPDELFSKAFVEALIANASDFYIRTRTQKAQENLDVLTRQVDSVRRELDEAIGGVAAATDANPNPNRALQRLRVGSQRRTIDVQANSAILTELVKNQELAKITLRNEKPVIQVLDRPIRPLKNNQIKPLIAVAAGVISGGLLAFVGLLLRYIYRRIMAVDPS